MIVFPRTFLVLVFSEMLGTLKLMILPSLNGNLFLIAWTMLVTLSFADCSFVVMADFIDSKVDAAFVFMPAHAVAADDFSDWIFDFADVTMLVTFVETDVFIASHPAAVFALSSFHLAAMFAFSSAAFALTVSQFFHSHIPAATAAATPKTIGLNDRPAIAALTRPKPFTRTPPNAAICGANVMSWPMPISSFPPMRSTGPRAATMRPIFAISCCCDSERLLNQSTAFCMPSATFRIVGASACPSDVAATSMLDFSFSIDPPKPDIIASAISAVVPSSPSAADRLSTSPGAVLISASQFDIWFLPKIADAAAICSDSERPANALCRSFCTVTESFIDPSAFVTSTPSFSSHAAPCFEGSTSLARPVFKEFAATFASMPLFAIMPMYRAASLTP